MFTQTRPKYHHLTPPLAQASQIKLNYLTYSCSLIWPAARQSRLQLEWLFHCLFPLSRKNTYIWDDVWIPGLIRCCALFNTSFSGFQCNKTPSIHNAQDTTHIFLPSSLIQKIHLYPSTGKIMPDEFRQARDCHIASSTGRQWGISNNRTFCPVLRLH